MKAVKLIFLFLVCSLYAFSQTAHNDNVNSLNFSADGKYLISASNDNTVKIWDFATHKLVKSIPVEKPAIFAAFTQNDKQIVTASYVGQKNSMAIAVKIWDLETGNEVRTLENEEDTTYYQCAYDPAGRYLATGSVKNKIIIFDIETGERLRYLDYGFDMRQLFFTDGGLFLLANPYEGSMKMFDSHSWGGNTPTKTKVCQVGASKDAKWIAYFENFGDPSMHIYNAETKTTNNYSSENMCKKVAFQNTQPNFAAAFSSGIYIYNLEKGKKLKVLKGHESDICSMCFSPDGKFLVTGGGKNYVSNDCSIRIWDTEKWKQVGSLVP